MITTFPSEVEAYSRAAANSFEELGGVRFAYAAERDDRLRSDAENALAQLGAWELDVRGDGDDLLAAAALARAAGAAALPYPLVPQLLSVDGRRLDLVDSTAPRIDHGDLPGAWLGADLTGSAWQVDRGVRSAGKLGPFLATVTLGAGQTGVPAGDVDLSLVLGAWRALGCAERALALVTEHVKVRVQFGKPLAEFQSVRFSVADTVVAVRGFAELALFTLSRVQTVEPGVRAADALVLRLKAIDTVRAVMRVSHQLLGAVGFCDEHDVSVLDRHIQPVLRLPVGAEAITDLLVSRVETGDLQTLFS